MDYNAEYGYKSGVILGGSGHLRIRVSPSQVAVEYVRVDKSVAHSYTSLNRGKL
jgi:predicted alpha-1,6-mannanase (GH76 family)